MTWVKNIADIVNALGAQGVMAVGVFLGFFITAAANYMAGSERRQRLKLDLDRLDKLHAQLELKDERINVLHEDIRNLSGGLPPKGKE